MARAMILTIFLLVLAVAMPVDAGTLVSDDFETYPAGTYPSPPWLNMFSGTSGLISTEQALSGTRSFRAECISTWARCDYVVLPEIPEEIEYRAAVFLTAADRGCGVGFGFVEPGTPNTGRMANAIVFWNNGEIHFDPLTVSNTLIGSWTTGKWYRVRVRINYATTLATVYLDGALVAEDVSTDPDTIPAAVYGEAVPLDQLCLFSNNFSGTGTAVVYYDDVLIMDGPFTAVVPSSWGRIKQLYR